MTLTFNWQKVGIELAIMPLLSVILLSVLPVCTTANIMLANNICDLQKDIKVKRYTLPYYLGRKALYLFSAIYYATYAAVILMVVLKILSPLCLGYLLTIIAVQKNINKFMEKQEKATTFMAAIKNYIIIMGTITILIFISAVI